MNIPTRFREVIEGIQQAEVADTSERQFLEGLAQTFAHDAVGF